MSSIFVMSERQVFAAEVTRSYRNFEPVVIKSMADLHVEQDIWDHTDYLVALLEGDPWRQAKLEASLYTILPLEHCQKD